MYTGPTIITDGLVLYLDAANPKSYPTTGTTWSDLSGNENNGTLINGPTFNLSNNGSIVFDGVNDYGSLGNSLGNGFSQITVNAWINVASLGNNIARDVISGCDGGSGGVPSVFNLSLLNLDNPLYLPSSFQGINIFFGIKPVGITRPIVIVDSSNYTAYLPGMAIAVNPIEFSYNKWINVCGVYTGTKTLLYINGVVKADSTLQPDGVNRSYSGTLNTTTTPRTVSNANRRFSGKISQTSIYNRALSDKEILQNYNATKSRFNI